MEEFRTDLAQTRRTDGAGYAYTPFRLEYRPADRLHTKEELLAILDLFYEKGVKAWWYSVSAKGSFPLFRSRSLPHRADADTGLYLWLVAEAKARGIALFSWEYMNTAPLLAAQRPEWRYRYFTDSDSEGTNRDRHFICHNSPYGELLKAYCLEVVGELGFDGIWFDGCYLYSDDSERMACRCAYCAGRYNRETGRDIPARADFREASFRQFMEWRYENFTAYWRALSGYVRERKPEAIVVLNYFNRMGHNAQSGSPLRRMPMEAMIASESCSRPYQVLMQHKILRALNDNYPTEVWDYFRDAAQNSAAVPEPEPASMLFHAQCSAAAGGYASFGFEAPPADYAELIDALNASLAPAAEYVGGSQPPCIGLVLSGATKDYGHINEEGVPDAWPTWQAVHGMHNLLTALHLPSEIVLDDMLTEGDLKRYQAVVLPDVRCLSDASAAALQAYVAAGGVLLATGRTGTWTETGEPREKGALDDWFGVTWRDARDARPLLRLRDDALLAAGMPERVMISGAAALMRATGCEVLATGEYRPPQPRHRFTDTGAQPNPNPLVEGDAVLLKRHGRGEALWIAANASAGYAVEPSRRTRALIGQLLEPRLRRPFTTDAPPGVAVTMWHQTGRVAFHLLNIPDRLHALPEHEMKQMFAEDVQPTGPIVIRVPGRWSKAVSPTGASVSFAQQGEEAVLTLAVLERHEVVVLYP